MALDSLLLDMVEGQFLNVWDVMSHSFFMIRCRMSQVKSAFISGRVVILGIQSVMFSVVLVIHMYDIYVLGCRDAVR